MLKKAVLIVAVAMIIMFGSSMSDAYQTGGLRSGLIGGAGQPLPIDVNFTESPFINPDGIGNYLFYGYYNVRGNLNLFNIVNTSTVDGVKVRMVFREGKDSQEILDFSICLSRGDVWTAYLADNGSGASIYGGVDTDTLTAPEITSAGVPFKFAGISHIDGTALTADDTREGYFEVISFNGIPNYDKNASTTAACTTTSGSQNCIRSAQACADWGTALSANTPPVISILGNNTIVNTSTLATYSYNAIAVQKDLPVAIAALPPGSPLSISNALGCTVADWLFAREAVIAPYDLITSIGGQTEVIITFPTRDACHSLDANGSANTNWTGLATFENPFNCHAWAAGDTQCTEFCTLISVAMYDDKEHLSTVLDFSPTVGTCLPNEVNVLKIGASNIWNSMVPVPVATSYSLGWISVGFGSAVSATHLQTNLVAPAVSQSGIPLVAYITQSFVNGSASYMVPAITRTNVY